MMMVAIFRRKKRGERTGRPDFFTEPNVQLGWVLKFDRALNLPDWTFKSGLYLEQDLILIPQVRCNNIRTSLIARPGPAKTMPGVLFRTGEQIFGLAPNDPGENGSEGRFSFYVNAIVAVCLPDEKGRQRKVTPR